MAALFGGSASSMTRPGPIEPTRSAPVTTGSTRPTADLNALIREAAKTWPTTSANRGRQAREAGKKLEELKRALEALNARQK